MSSEKEALREKTVDELREQTRAHGVRGASSKTKEELVSTLARSSSGSPRSLRAWARDRSLGLFFLALFLLTWIGQLLAQWFSFVNEQQDHKEVALLGSGEF